MPTIKPIPVRTGITINVAGFIVKLCKQAKQLPNPTSPIEDWVQAAIDPPTTPKQQNPSKPKPNKIAGIKAKPMSAPIPPY